MKTNFLITAVVMLFFVVSTSCGKNENSIPQDIVSEVRLTDITSTYMTVSWTPIANTNKYEVRYSSNSNMSGSITTEANSSSVLIDELEGNTHYYVQMRAIVGSASAEWSEIVSAKTAAFTTTIGTYNMKSITNDVVHPNNKWADRKNAFRDIVLQANYNPDVLGIQEAEDLGQVNEAISLLGNSYDHHLFERVVSPRLLLWKKNKYSLIETSDYDLLAGAYPPDEHYAGRYATYAKLREIGSQGYLHVFVIHPPYEESRQVVRNVMANKIAEIAINLSSQNNNEPVVVMGDFNNYPATVINGVIGTPMVLTEHGLIDTFHATQYKANTNYGTMNDIVNGLAVTGTNGSRRIDYIFFYPENKITVSDYRTIINFATGSATNLQKPIPSDHNPVRATLNVFY